MSRIVDPTQGVQPGLAVPGRSDEEMGKEASVPLPPGLQAIRLTQEQAEVIRTLLDEASHAHEGGEMPTADASVLRKKDG